MRYRSALLLPLSLVLLPSPAGADIAADLAACAAVTDDAARLGCFDDLAARLGQAGTSVDVQAAMAALDREFRFDRTLRVQPLQFRLNASAYLSVSRETGPGRDVERLARRIDKAIGDIAGWTLAVTVHGAQVTLPRSRPLTGAELMDQASQALARSGLPASRFTLTRGDDAEPSLWDDGRVRGSNEHIIVDIVGLGGGDLGN